MKSIKAPIFKIVLAALFVAGAFVFFCWPYRYHLHFHEQLQMFLTTHKYFVDVAMVPGGVADYIGRFLTQFFLYPAAGAAIMALLLWAMQWLTWRVCLSHTPVAYALSFVPALLMWLFYCDENAMLSALVATDIALLAAFAIDGINSMLVRVGFWVIATPVVYMVSGPIGLVFTVIAVINELSLRQSKKIKLMLCAIAVGLIVICPYTAHNLYTYSLHRLLWGVHYMRFAAFAPTGVWIAVAAVVVVTTISRFTELRRRAIAIASVIYALIIAGGIAIILKNSDFDKERAFEFDYLARNGRWDDIVKAAAENEPHDQMSTIYKNLAFAKTGVLCDRISSSFQAGSDGLLAPFGDNFFLPFATAEAMYQLGVNKAAQRLTYEIQESIPDRQMSVRCAQRLADAAIINGEYELARKYLNTLSNTLLYRKWANERMKLIGNPSALANHRDFAAVTVVKPRTDYFITDVNFDTVLRTTLADNPNNRMMFEYLAAYYLLNQDIEKLPEIMALGSEVKYNKLPRDLEEALSLVWWHDHDSWDGIPWAISADTKGRFMEFARAYFGKNSYIPPSAANTYWGLYFK